MLRPFAFLLSAFGGCVSADFSGRRSRLIGMRSKKFTAVCAAVFVGVLPISACGGGGLGGGISARSLSGTWDCVDEGDQYGDTYPVVFYQNGNLMLDGDQGTWSIVSRSGNVAQVQIDSYSGSTVSEVTAINNNQITVADYSGSSFCTRR